MKEPADPSLERKLELATSRDPVDPAPWDRETAELHGAWKSLSELLETADRHAEVPPLEVRRTRDAFWRTPRQLVAASVAAAVLFFLAGAWVYYRSVDGDPQLSLRQQKSVSVSGGKTESVLRSSSAEDTEAESALEWNNSSLDEQLAMVELDLLELELESGPMDSWVESLHDQLETWQLEFEQNTL